MAPLCLLLAMQVEAIELHHLDPRLDEVADEMCVSIRCSVDLGLRTQLRVGSECKINSASCPTQLTRLTIATLEEVVIA